MSKLRKRTLREYLRKKSHKLTTEETQQIRHCIKREQVDVYKLASEFGCVPTQIAGIKAHLNR